MPSGTFAVSNNSSGLSTEIRWFTTDDAANNRSYITVELWARRSASTTYGNGSFALRIGGDEWVAGNASVGQSWVLVAARGAWIGHSADGGLGVEVGVAAGGKPNTSWTSTSGTQWVSATDYSRPPGAPSAAPTLARSATGTSLTITSATASSPVSISRYEYQTSSNNSTWLGAASLNGSRQATVSLGASEVIYVRTRAVSSEGAGPWSASRVSAGVPQAPSSISPSRVGRDVTVTVGTSPGNGGATITGYTVRWSADGGALSAPVTVSDGVATFASLAPAKTYTFYAYATNSTGDSPAAVSAPLFVPAGGKRWTGSAHSPTSIARRATASGFVDLTLARRWTGSAWVDLS